MCYVSRLLIILILVLFCVEIYLLSLHCIIHLVLKTHMRKQYKHMVSFCTIVLYLGIIQPFYGENVVRATEKPMQLIIKVTILGSDLLRESIECMSKCYNMYHPFFFSLSCVTALRKMSFYYYCQICTICCSLATQATHWDANSFIG